MTFFANPWDYLSPIEGFSAAATYDLRQHVRSYVS